MLYDRVHRAAFATAAHRGWHRLHAATVEHPCGRVLLVGPSGAGKTTLACELIRRQGLAVPADESVVIRGTSSIPVARRFHLKPGIARFDRELDRLWGTLPGVADGTIRAWDPVESGHPCLVTERPIGAIVVMAGRGAACLTPSPVIDAMPTIIDNLFPFDERLGDLIGRTARLVDHLPVWTLAADDPAEAGNLLAQQRLC